jgi:hypothetical protein
VSVWRRRCVVVRLVGGCLLFFFGVCRCSHNAAPTKYRALHTMHSVLSYTAGGRGLPCRALLNGCLTLGVCPLQASSGSSPGLLARAFAPTVRQSVSGRWVAYDSAVRCCRCGVPFTKLVPRHHCRR